MPIHLGQLLRTGVLLVGVLIGLAPGFVRADILGQIWINQSARVGNASLANVPPEPADAKFKPIAIDYDSRIDGYSIRQFLHDPVFFETSSSFDPDGTSNNTFYLFTGTLFLNAGPNNFVVPHDDGLQLNIDGIGLVVDRPGPTAPVVTPFTVSAPAAGEYSFQLSYGEGFGPPGVLRFIINDRPVGNPSVPDGGITLFLLSTGLGSVGAFARRFRG